LEGYAPDPRGSALQPAPLLDNVTYSKRYALSLSVMPRRRVSLEPGTDDRLPYQRPQLRAHYCEAHFVSG